VTIQYSMVIKWSDEDKVYVVSLPEFGKYSKTHGDTYEDAAKNGQEVLELLIETYQAEGRPLPAPSLFGPPVPAA
jgi:predicted RNase H-like HicB family nuclease